MIESPAITGEAFMRGYLEGLLSARLDTVEATVDRMVLEIKEKP